MMDSTSRPRKPSIKLYRQELDRENIGLTVCVFFTFSPGTNPHTQTIFFHMTLPTVEGTTMQRQCELYSSRMSLKAFRINVERHRIQRKYPETTV